MKRLDGSHLGLEKYPSHMICPGVAFAGILGEDWTSTQSKDGTGWQNAETLGSLLPFVIRM